MKRRWLVTLSLFYFFQLASAFAGTYLPRYLGLLGMSGTAIGLAYGLQAVARSVAMPLWSYASDRFGISVRLVRVQFLLAIPFLALPFTEDTRVLTALLVLSGITLGCAVPVTDVVTIRELSAQAFGRIRAVGSTGFGVAAACFAFLGLSMTHTELARISVWVVVGLLVLAAGTASFFPRSTASLSAAGTQELAKMFKNRWLLVLMPLWALHWASQVPYNMYLVYFAESRGFAAWMPGASVVVAILAEVLFLAFGSKLVERLGPLVSFTLAVGSTAVRWFLMAYLDDPIVVVALQLVHGLTFGGFMLSMMSVLNREVPTGVRATAQAVLYVVVFGLGGALGQFVSGRLLDTFGAVSLFETMGWLELALFIPTAVISLYYRRAGRHRMTVLS